MPLLKRLWKDPGGEDQLLPASPSRHGAIIPLTFFPSASVRSSDAVVVCSPVRCLELVCASSSDKIPDFILHTHFPVLFLELFDNYMQQDAHEFLNYLLNTIADILQEERKQEKQNGRLRNGDVDNEDNNSTPDPTWVHEIFQGTLTNETRCLTCETVSPSA